MRSPPKGKILSTFPSHCVPLLEEGLDLFERGTGQHIRGGQDSMSEGDRIALVQKDQAFV